MAITVTDVITQFGALYKNEGQTINNIYSKFYKQTDTTSYMTPVYTDDDTWRATEIVDGQALQAFHKNFTPSGDETFTPLEIPLYQFKIDRLIDPNVIENTWLGFLAGDGVERKDWPLVKYLIENRIIPKALRDYELSEIYKGVYAAPAGVVAPALGTAMNGLGKIIADGIVAGSIVPITTGAISTDPATFVGQVETFANGIVAVNADYVNLPMNIFLSPTLMLRYRSGYRAKYSLNTDFSGQTEKVQDTNYTVIGLSSMIGKNRMFATVKENFIDLRSKKREAAKLELQPFDRTVKVLGDFKRGAGFGMLGAVFCNEQV